MDPFAAVVQKSSIVELNISNNSIGNSGAISIVSILKANELDRKLRKLDLSRNKIGHEGATAVWEAIKTNAVLNNLNLEGNQFGSRGVS